MGMRSQVVACLLVAAAPGVDGHSVVCGYVLVGFNCSWMLCRWAVHLMFATCEETLEVGAVHVCGELCMLCR